MIGCGSARADLRQESLKRMQQRMQNQIVQSGYLSSSGIAAYGTDIQRRKMTPPNATIMHSRTIPKSHQAVPRSHGNLIAPPLVLFQSPCFGLHMANIGGGVISCAHFRHSSLAPVRPLSNARFRRDWNSNFSYNGLPMVDASIQHSRFRLSARRTPTSIKRRPTP